MSIQDVWEQWGTYFGYKKCCIATFCEQKFSDEPRKLQGTGFVPCDECNKLDEADIVADINSRRLEPKAFPEMTSDEEWDELMKKQGEH